MYREEYDNGEVRYFFGDQEITRDEYEFATNQKTITVLRFNVSADGRIDEVI